MTKTDAYNRMIELFDAGRLGALDENGSGCAYIDGDKRCVIGALIPDDLVDTIANSRFNSNTSVTALLEEFPQLEAAIPFTCEQAEALQSYHDAAFDPVNGYEFTPAQFRALLVNLRDGLVTKMPSSIGSRFLVDMRI